MRGDVIIQGLLYLYVDVILDRKLGDYDTDTYKYEPMTSLLVR